MSKGGKRKGAGVKEGSIRPKLNDFWSQDDISEYFDWLKGAYQKDSRLAVFVGEHIIGKAVQPIGNDDKPFEISGVTIKVRK